MQSHPERKRPAGVKSAGLLETDQQPSKSKIIISPSPVDFQSPFAPVYPDISRWGGLKQSHIDWLLRSGVTVPAMIWPEAIRLAKGTIAADGRFDETQNGLDRLVFTEPSDVIFWQPKSGRLGTWSRHVFALGEEAVDDPGTYAFDCALNIFASPLDWLRAKRDGIVILDWSIAFDRLRDCPRVAVSEGLLFQYRRHMKPAHLPETLVIRDKRRAAA